MVEAGAPASSLSKLDILVAQLESIVASANAQAPDPLMCFDLLSDLLSSLQEHSKETVLGCQRKCEDALQSLLLLGARPPVRRLAAKALIQIIEKGDSISVYSRASSLQGWLSEMKKVDASSYIGAAHCLGALYRSYGQRITSGLPETSNIVVKLLKLSEVPVRQAALQLLQDALEGSGGGGSASAYSEALRAVLRIGAVDKSSVVRTAAAGCLRACALAGGPGLGAGGLENCAALCVKALEDPSQSVRDAYAAALGSLLALGLNPDAQIQPRGKSQLTPSKTLEGGLQKYLVGPFMRATGPLYRDIRVGLTMAWVAFLQGMHLTYGHSDMELQNYALQAMGMLTFNSKSQIDAHSQACVLYILRVGVVEQMSEATQKEFLVLLTKQLSVADTSSSMLVVILRTISHLLGILGEVLSTAREALENCLMVALSNSTMAVRVETALTIRALAEVDSSCANSMMSFGVTTLRALRETVVIEKGERLRDELDSLHGHALMLAALSVASAKLPLGVPSRLPAAILELAKRMVSENGSSPISAGVEKEAGWLLVGAIVSSLTKEEIKEQEFDVIALWTIPFGGNTESRLKKAEENLSAEVRVWSAAMEALTSFVKSYVIPHLSSEKEGILLQPILGYLNGALTYLSSPLLQRASNELKQVVDVFTVRTLAAYQALPEPFCYKADHNMLLNLCAGPFRDPSLWGGSSSLRQLLDCRDASLGPWIPGRDSSEDELRAFEGGSDGPLPCVWENNVCVFPQPLSVATLLVNEMMLCFGLVFTAQRESKKMVYLDLMEASIRSSKKQSWQETATTNICVALLAALKVSLGIRAAQYEPDIFRRFQSIFQGILAEETSTVPHRRAAAEGLGILARLGNDVFAARLMRSLLTEAASASDIYLRGCIAFACGCIHRSKGGMALSVLIPATVQTICTIAKDPKDSLHIWSLHGLWLTIEAAGLAYVPFVQVTMSLAMDILLSEEHAGPELQQCLGRLVNAIIAVTGPELSPGSSFFSRCKSVVAEMSSGNEPAALLESVLFTQQLVLFAPQAVSVHTHVQTLTATLSSRQPSLRQAAVSTLRHLAEKDPKSVIEEHIEENLFAMLDTETDPGIISLVRRTLLRLLEAACPSCPSRWLHLCRNVVLAASNTISAGGRVGSSNGDYRNPVEVSSKDEAFVDDEEGMISRPDQSNMEAFTLGSFGSIESKSKEGEQLPRYSTRLFAAECVSRLITAVGDDARHFNLFLAKEDHTHSKHKGDWLVLQLGQLVALSYQVATGVFESLRAKGVTILVTILQKFGETEDPDFSGHLLLEQYQAQFISAVRTALDSAAGPALLESGLQLAPRIITSGISSGDIGVFRRIITLLSHLLHDFEELQYPSYAESVGCKVQASLLGAYAAVKSYAHNCVSEASNKKKEGTALLELLGKDSNKLRDFWIGLLKDFTVLRVSTSSQWQLKYKPFLGGLLLPAVATTIKPCLDEMWPAVLEAVTTDAVPCPSEKESSLSLKHQSCLSSADFCQLWALCHLILCQGNKQSSWKTFTRSSFSATSFKVSQVGITPGISDGQIIALHAMLPLCKDGCYGPSMLSSDLCKELFQVLLAVCLKTQTTVAVHLMPVLKQVLKYSPDEYVKCDDLVFSATEICVFYIHQVLCSYVAKIGSFLEADSVMGLIFETLEIVIQRTAFEKKNQLLPMFVCLGVKFIILAPSATSSLTVAVSFVSNLALLLAKLEVGQQLSTMESAVQSLVECCNDRISKANVEDKSMKDMDESTSKLSRILYLLMDFARICIEISGSIEASENTAQKLILIQCIGSLHRTLTATHREVQLAGLQILRNVAQTSMAEGKQGPSYELTLLLMQELGAAVVGIVYDLVKAPLTAKAAIAVGESLKLLVLLHSLVKSEESQQEILYVLLPAIITAASADGKGETQQVAGSLRTVAVKLVTHLASQPESAVQFKSVLVNMPVELRQKLQDTVRASISQSSSAEIIASASLPHGTAPKLVIPIPIVNPSPQPAVSSVVPSSDNSHHDDDEDDDDDGHDDKHDDEDDDWDDFQSYPVSEMPLVHTEGGNQMSEESNSALDEEPMNATEVQDESIPEGQIEFEEARSDHAYSACAISQTHADPFEGGLPSQLGLLPGPTSDSPEEAVQESRREDEAVDVSSESNPPGSKSTGTSIPEYASAENGEEGSLSEQDLLPGPTSDSPQEAVQEIRREDEAVYVPSETNPTGSNSTGKSLSEGTSAENGDVENLRTLNEAQEVD